MGRVLAVRVWDMCEVGMRMEGEKGWCHELRWYD
jgi:hypothetical protein